MNPIVIIVIAVIVVAVILVVFVTRRKALPGAPDEAAPKLPPREPRRPKPSDKPKPERDPAAPKPREAEPEALEPGEAPPPPYEDEEVDVAPSEPPPPEEEEEPVDVAPPPPSVTERERDVKGLRRGLAKARESGGFFGRLKALFTGAKEVDPHIAQDMEEILLTSDVGVSTTDALLADIKERLERKELTDADRVWDALHDRSVELLQSGAGAIRLHDRPTVVLMVGVNGTGKTTTIGKLATTFLAHHRRVLLVAADTFRAAAVQQLQIWGKRVGCDVFAGEEGADPASVVFDAIKQGVEDAVDVILVDTAGRLHTKANLMDELKKVARTADKALAGAPHETLLVVDATTGQNAVQQAATFKEALPLTGLVLTKLDGTAKGGVVLGISAEHDLPVRYIGVGERAEDLRDFDAAEFVEAMLGRGEEDAAEAA